MPLERFDSNVSNQAILYHEYFYYFVPSYLWSHSIIKNQYLLRDYQSNARVPHENHILAWDLDVWAATDQNLELMKGFLHDFSRFLHLLYYLFGHYCLGSLLLMPQRPLRYQRLRCSGSHYICFLTFAWVSYCWSLHDSKYSRRYRNGKTVL